MTDRINKDEILESAKTIMNNFMNELNKAEESNDNFGQIRKTNIRPKEVGDTNKTDDAFIKRVFDNAPRKKDNFILAETQKRDE